MKLYKIKFDNKKLINSNIIDKRGFFIGLPTKKMKQKTLDKISELLLSVSKF